MPALADITFYKTAPHACSYLAEQQASTVFIDPFAPIDAALYETLCSLGFRRSGEHFYRPQCAACAACIPARVPVQAFSFGQAANRVLKRNSDLSISWVKPYESAEPYTLYQRYLEARHSDGDMYPPDRAQFNGFLMSDLAFAYWLEFRLEKRLLAIAVTDKMPNALSAVYTFFEPTEASRSLGRLAILWQIKEAQRLNMQALYLGYWIKNCAKMSYKTQYRPIELRLEQQWTRLNEQA